MDILSTGQKIKRARIYKGITLKELCKDKISISKMSCIENGKIKADTETIEYISKIIDVEYEYLAKDTYEQIVCNLIEIKKDIARKEGIVKSIIVNLRYATEYEYFELAFELNHIMFSYYLIEEEYEKLEERIDKYYNIYQRVISDKNTIIYLLDIAQYFFQREEYREAVAYYTMLSEFDIMDNDTEEIYLKIQLYEAKCYYELHNYEKAYESLKRIVELSETRNWKLNYGEALNYYVLVCIRLGYDGIDKYIIDIDKYTNKNSKLLAISKKKFAEAYFSIENRESGIEEISKAINLFPYDNKEIYVEFINKCIEVYKDNNELNKAYELSEGNLNLSIQTQNIKLIEKSYYLKGKILERLERFKEAEIYMNLSLDSLLKFGSKQERYKRYVDMGNLYYKLENTHDSIKYFNLAITLEKLI